MKQAILIMMAAAAFWLAAGNAQAEYYADYNVEHVNLRSEQTGEVTASVTFTSALDGKSYFISEAQFREAQCDGVRLANYLIESARQDYPPTSLDESRDDCYPERLQQTVGSCTSRRVLQLQATCTSRSP
jgi:hypothetical protein